LSFSENKGCFTFGGLPPKDELCIHSYHFPYIILAIYPVSLFAKNPVFLFTVHNSVVFFQWRSGALRGLLCICYDLLVNSPILL